jgi:hypothetical protein
MSGVEACAAGQTNQTKTSHEAEPETRRSEAPSAFEME